MVESIVLGFIGSGALATVLSAIITAIANRNGIKSKLRKIEKDTVRLQLLFLIYATPDDTQEIMTAGQYYFETLKANWYMSSVFDNWLKKQGIERPRWFRGNGGEE